MTNISRFGKSFVGKIVVPGTKVNESVRPELLVVSTKDKFVLNDKARKMLNVQLGDRVMLIDDMDEATTMNDRFYIVPNFTNKAGVLVGAKLGKGYSFSYSGVWSAVHMDDVTIVAAQPKDLVAANKAIIREKTVEKDGETSIVSTCIATQKVAYELVPVLNDDGENLHVVEKDGEPTARVFALINAQTTPHDPREMSDADIDAENAEIDETVED